MVSNRILQQALRAARPGNDVVAELETGGAQPLHLAGKVVHVRYGQVN